MNVNVKILAGALEGVCQKKVVTLEEVIEVIVQRSIELGLDRRPAPISSSTVRVIFGVDVCDHLGGLGVFEMIQKMQGTKAIYYE